MQREVNLEVLKPLFRTMSTLGPSWYSEANRIMQDYDSSVLRCRQPIIGLDVALLIIQVHSMRARSYLEKAAESKAEG